MKYWYKGKIFTDQPFLSPSLSIQRADGVFESILTQNDKIFFFDRHIERMKKAADKLGILDFDETSIRAGANELVKHQQNSEFNRMRINLYSDGEVYLSIEKTELTKDLATLTIYPFRKFSSGIMSGIKSTSYAESAAAVRYAQKQNCTDSLLLNEKEQVVETGYSNFIYKLDEIWYTPTLNSGCLPGIVREVLVAEDIVKEQDLSYSNLTKIQSAGLLSSIRLIQLVSAIDTQQFAYSESDSQFVARTRQMLLTN